MLQSVYITYCDSICSIVSSCEQADLKNLFLIQLGELGEYTEIQVFTVVLLHN